MSCSIFRMIFYKRCMWNGSGSNVDISQPPSGWGTASVWMAWKIILVMLLKHNTNHFANPLHWALNTARCRSSQAWERQLCTCATGSCSFVLLPSLLFLLSRAIIESLHKIHILSAEQTYLSYHCFYKKALKITRLLFFKLTGISALFTISVTLTNNGSHVGFTLSPNGVDVTSCKTIFFGYRCYCRNALLAVSHDE